MADDSPRNADFVGRMVPDAKNPPETRMLTGWLGDAAEKGNRRLYTDAELRGYIDFPANAILYSEPVRDAQPSGCVFIWVKRDAALKYGGSASSRAARFLHGQVEQDYASGGGGPDLSSPEKAGFRCVTQVPCGEPTGFTGQCTKQPDVGGAWPCITAIPHCTEPTGFTGQCTNQPWPLPTRYIGCTFLHCPTRDLTHIQHICNIVATGVPGCPIVDPRGGSGPEAKAAAAEAGNEGAHGSAERAAAPATSIPGCGYTKTWGLCETQLLGCGYTQQWGLCQQTQPPRCNVSVDIPCITQTETPQCFVGGAGGVAGFRAAAPGPAINTQPPCSAVDTCPTHGCTVAPGCTIPPTGIPPCTQVGPQCPTKETVCTQIGPQCPTSCGVDCQTQQHNCTQLGEICLTRPVECTQSGPKCPPTQTGPDCPIQTPFCRAALQVTYPSGDCTFFGCPPTPATVCTQSGPRCPTYPSGDCTFFGCPPITQTFHCGGPSAIDACPTRLCAARPATGFYGCTQLGPQCPTVACEVNTFSPRCTGLRCYKIQTEYAGCWGWDR